MKSWRAFTFWMSWFFQKIGRFNSVNAWNRSTNSVLSKVKPSKPRKRTTKQWFKYFLTSGSQSMYYLPIVNPKILKVHTIPYTWKSSKNSHLGLTLFMRMELSNRSKKFLNTAPLAHPTFSSNHFSASSSTICCSSDNCLYLNVFKH